MPCLNCLNGKNAYEKMHDILIRLGEIHCDVDVRIMPIELFVPNMCSLLLSRSLYFYFYLF